MKRDLKLLISGPFSTSKTITTKALSIATGIPSTFARNTHDILPSAFPEKCLDSLNATDLIELGLCRLEDRILNEANFTGPFISDFSIIDEWIYREMLLNQGIHPNTEIYYKILFDVIGWHEKLNTFDYLNSDRVNLKALAQQTYDAYVHLPIDYNMHLSVEQTAFEKTRTEFDKKLLASFKELGIPCHVVDGSIHHRLAMIINTLDLPMIHPIDDAITRAIKSFKLFHKEIEKQHLEITDQSKIQSVLKTRSVIAG